MTGHDDTVTLPTRSLLSRLTRDLAQRDHLLGLLAQVSDGHQLTNRLGEAIVLVPETLLTEIRQAIGATTPEGTPTTHQETHP